jgi:hypothetical protein
MDILTADSPRIVIRLGRFGTDAISLTNMALLFADDLVKLRGGDLGSSTSTATTLRVRTPGLGCTAYLPPIGHRQTALVM